MLICVAMPQFYAFGENGKDHDLRGRQEDLMRNLGLDYKIV